MLVIMGVLVAVVTVGVVGLMGRGEEESFDVDERVMQLAVVTFYADTHVYSQDDGWNEGGGSAGHYYPTAGGGYSPLYPGDEVDFDGNPVHELWSAPGVRATTAEVRDAAIWMPLLVNAPGDGDVTGAGPDVAPGDDNSPLQGEEGPYLFPEPKSCSTHNASVGKGSYTWIVGNYGRVYGVFEQDGIWYAGFGGWFP